MNLKFIKKNLFNILIPNILYFIFQIFRSTWKWSEDELPLYIQEKIKAGEPVVFGHLHEDEWGLLGIYANRQMWVLVSMSEDGELMTRFLKKIGFSVSRGSSSRGGVRGLLSMLKGIKESSGTKNLSLAVDGPRGPRRVVKAGILSLAKHLKAPIVLGSIHAKSAWVFRSSWSKAFLPKPFTSLNLKYAKVLTPETLNELEDEVILSEMANRLIRVKSMAKKSFTH